MLPYGVAANIVCSATDAGAHGAEGAADACAEVRDDRDAGDQDQGKHDCVFDGGGSVIAGQETGNQGAKTRHGSSSPHQVSMLFDAGCRSYSRLGYRSQPVR